MNFADIISSAWGFSPLDSIFVLAVLVLIAAGLKKNHGLKKEERELKEKIAKLGIGAVNAVETIEESQGIPFESDVREGLEYLGYSPKEIALGIKRVSNNIPANATAQDVISMILQSLN